MPIGNPTQRDRTHASVGVSVLAMVVVLLAGGCTQPAVNLPQPDSPIGFYALEFTTTAPPRFSSLADGASGAVRAGVVDGPLAREDIVIEPSGASGVFRLGGGIYVHAEFLLTNESDEPLENLVLLGYHRPEFRVGSAVSQPVFVGSNTAVPDALVRRIAPTHTLFYQGSAADPDVVLLGSPTRSDFVAFEEADVPSVPLSGYGFVTSVFPYGFAVRSLDDPHNRTVAPGAVGQVHVAFALPAGSAHERNIGSFIWNAVLVSADQVRVTQAVEENHPAGWDATLARAASDAPGVIVAIGPGTRVTPAALCDTVLCIDNVRIAGTDTSDADFTTLIPVSAAPEFAGCEGAP